MGVKMGFDGVRKVRGANYTASIGYYLEREEVKRKAAAKRRRSFKRESLRLREVNQ